MAAPKGKFYEELGRRIAAARGKRELSQQRLATHLRLSRTSITNIEKGRQPVDVHVLVEIANALGVSLLKLIPEESVFKKPEETPDFQKYGAEERKFIESILGNKTSSK
jgi:transcriptional regulator with XRE-family HTH domain